MIVRTIRIACVLALATASAVPAQDEKARSPKPTTLKLVAGSATGTNRAPRPEGTPLPAGPATVVEADSSYEYCLQICDAKAERCRNTGVSAGSCASIQVQCARACAAKYSH